jgi:hypothetical protein
VGSIFLTSIKVVQPDLDYTGASANEPAYITKQTPAGKHTAKFMASNGLVQDFAPEAQAPPVQKLPE